MSNLELTRLKETYKILKLQREEAEEHFKMCITHHDQDSAKSWKNNVDAFNIDMQNIYNKIMAYYN